MINVIDISTAQPDLQTQSEPVVKKEKEKRASCCSGKRPSSSHRWQTHQLEMALTLRGTKWCIKQEDSSSTEKNERSESDGRMGYCSEKKGGILFRHDYYNLYSRLSRYYTRSKVTRLTFVSTLVMVVERFCFLDSLLLARLLRRVWLVWLVLVALDHQLLLLFSDDFVQAHPCIEIRNGEFTGIDRSENRLHDDSCYSQTCF